MSGGDESKGSITDYLVRKSGAKWNIRFSGGSQTAHRVVTENKSHIFRQFGAGTFAGANTLFTENVLFDPYSLIKEYQELKTLGENPKFYVHENCLIITPAHVFKNIKEAEESGHGSTGSGCWATLQDSFSNPGALRAKDINSLRFWGRVDALFNRFNITQPRHPRFTYDYAAYIAEFSNCFQVVNDDWISENVHSNLIFEGNQGLLLDPQFGFHPNTTANSTTPENAHKFINKFCKEKESQTVGVIRHYMSRHGAGVFPSEDKSVQLVEHNPPGKFSGAMRYGHFDKMMFDYAMSIVKPDILAISCLDQNLFQDKYVERYEGFNYIPGLSDFNNLSLHEKRTGLISKARPIYKAGKFEFPEMPKILSYGPNASSKYESSY